LYREERGSMHALISAAVVLLYLVGMVFFIGGCLWGTYAASPMYETKLPAWIGLIIGGGGLLAIVLGNLLDRKSKIRDEEDW
jgi:hypothetical protein